MCSSGQSRRIGFYLVIAVLCGYATCGCQTGPSPEALAGDAFKLRMAGQHEQASQVLAEALAAHPGAAVLYYEQARMILHQALGKPREILDQLAEADRLAAKAIELEPDEPAYFVLSAELSFMQAYAGMQQGSDDVAMHVKAACDAFEAALKLRPECEALRLWLVELYGDVPEEYGGDPQAAATHQTALDTRSEVWGLKAKSILEEVEINEWEKLRERQPGNALVLEELGKAYLREERFEEARACFDEAIRLDPGLRDLLLDLGRHHVFAAIRLTREGDKEALAKSLQAAEDAFVAFIDEDQADPIGAYAYEMLAKVKRGQGDTDRMNELRAVADGIDPYHSRATGCPPDLLFLPPGEMVERHRYLARPY